MQEKAKLSGIDKWAFTLREFINLAAKFKIKYIYNSGSKSYEYSPVLEYYINSVGAFELFRSELAEKISQAQDPRVFLDQIKSEFLPMISRYKSWFEEHEKDTAIFAEYNPYEVMKDAVIRTEREIEQYSKQSDGRKHKTPVPYAELFKDPVLAGRVKDILEKHGFTKKGVWNFDCIYGTTNKTSLVAAIAVLRGKNVFKADYQNEKSLLGRIFYKEFGIEKVIPERSFSFSPSVLDIEIFTSLFSQLLSE